MWRIRETRGKSKGREAPSAVTGDTGKLKGREAPSLSARSADFLKIHLIVCFFAIVEIQIYSDHIGSINELTIYRWLEDSIYFVCL